MRVGKKLLITTDGWFYAPDGQAYRAVHGTLKGIHDSKEALGIETNSRSTNWYVEIGNMIIAGCQIHYAIQAEKVNYESSKVELNREMDVKLADAPTRIYNADS